MSEEHRWIKDSGWISELARKQANNEIRQPAPGLTAEEHVKLSMCHVRSAFMEMTEARDMLGRVDSGLNLAASMLYQLITEFEWTWLDRRGEVEHYQSLEDYRAAVARGEIGWSVRTRRDRTEGGGGAADGGRVASDAEEDPDEAYRGVPADA